MVATPFLMAETCQMLWSTSPAESRKSLIWRETEQVSFPIEVFDQPFQGSRCIVATLGTAPERFKANVWFKYLNTHFQDDSKMNKLCQ
jgi:hypothetical protein